MKKKFDCVKMKRDIQEQLHKETEGMSLRERVIYLKNKPLSPQLQKTVDRINQYHKDNNNNVFNFAEPKSEYKTNLK